MIRLAFSSFDVEQQETCEFDSVSVYDGADNNSELLSRLCGDSLPAVIRSTNHYLYIKFVTDKSKTFSGFRVTVTFLYP